MTHVETIGVALPQDLAAEVRGAVPSGDYSVNEVVLDAPRDWRLRRKVEAIEAGELGRLALEGIESGPGQDADTGFSQLRARFGQPTNA